MHKILYTQSVGETSAHADTPRAPRPAEREQVPHVRLPRWIRITPKTGPGYERVKTVLKHHGLHSVCQEAACPNIRECFDEGTATFMVLGNHCTRGCNFCDVIKSRPLGLDTEEPARLAKVVAELHLNQVVITSVTRDDLPDGGASIFCDIMTQLRLQDETVKVEFLVPDFGGNLGSVQLVLDSGVDVFAHNVETVSRLYKRVRPGMKIDRSLAILQYASAYRPKRIIKTGFMVGLGETIDEIIELLEQIYATGTDIVTIGQYLRPSLSHLPVERFYRPDEFDELKEIGMRMGFGHVESGPLVRSSYKAFNQSSKLLESIC